MKSLFIPARYIGKVAMNMTMIEKLPKKIGLLATSQFLACLTDIKSQIENSGREVFIWKSLQGNDGQILGCDVSSSTGIEKNVDAFLYIGSGEFHPRGVALKTLKDIFIFNPLTGGFSVLDRKEIETYTRKKRAAYLKFLSSQRIGIIVSLKHGQNNLIESLELKERMKDKEVFVFIAETIDFLQLGNFPFIECWVNTACPRIDEDLVCVNLSEILKYTNHKGK